MKIAFITHAIGVGGGSLSSSTTIRYLIDNEYLKAEECIIIHGKTRELTNEKNNVYFSLKKQVKFFEFKLPFSPVYKGTTSNPFIKLYQYYNEFVASFYFIFFYNKILEREKITIVHLNSLVLWPLLLVLPKSMKKIIHIREVPNNSIEARIAIFVITRYANKIISIDPISNEAFSNLKKSVVIFNPFNMKRARQLREKKDEIKLKYKIQPATFVISIIGRIEEPKGHNLLFEIVEKFTNQNLFFLIVGLPSGVYGKKFLEKSYHYKNIKYIGEINEIEEIYAITDIILRLDTVDYLPLGRTVWEGLFAGCICVIPVKRSFNIYPIQHLINKYIFVYKYCDPENLINMLKQIISEQSDTIQNTSYPIMDNSEENALQFDKILRDLS